MLLDPLTEYVDPVGGARPTGCALHPFVEEVSFDVPSYFLGICSPWRPNSRVAMLDSAFTRSIGYSDSPLGEFSDLILDTRFDICLRCHICNSFPIVGDAYFNGSTPHQFWDIKEEGRQNMALELPGAIKLVSAGEGATM